MDDINTLRRILGENRVIAIVGLSADWYRPSYFAAKYMREHGYRIIPVNPKYPEILGEKCYGSLRDIPEKVQIVDVFRKTQDVPPVADDAIAIGAKVLWQQLGVKNEAAAARARVDARRAAARAAGSSRWRSARGSPTAGDTAHDRLQRDCQRVVEDAPRATAIEFVA